MQNEIKNKITHAINQGINLGYDLCDIDINDNSNINQDLQKKKLNFKDLDDKTLKNVYIPQLISQFLNDENEEEISLIQEFCLNYKDEYYEIYQVRSSEELQDLIRKICYKISDESNLNWIDVSKISDMTEMFSDTYFNGDISKWNVRNVTVMEDMFAYSEFNGDISQWNVSKVRDMNGMFRNSQFNGDLSQWDVHNVRDIQLIFDEANFNGDLSNWKLSLCKGKSEIDEFR